MIKHWSGVWVCSCGMRFSSYAAEARHRHNFPILCRPKRAAKIEPERAPRTKAASKPEGREDG